MTALHLDSLEIKNFRTFKHLTIEKLGRVNLIVGKNSVGKTALLEALWLYAARSPSLIWDILYRHDEISDIQLLNNQTEKGFTYRVEASKNLFYGRPESFKDKSWLEVGPIGYEGKLRLSARRVPKDYPLKHILGSDTTDRDDNSANASDPILVLKLGQEGNVLYLDRTHQLVDTLKRLPYVFLGSDGFTSKTAEFWWEQTVLTTKENTVIQVLKIINESIQRVAFVNPGESPQGRIPMVQLANGNKRPVPLRSLGEGLNQLFGVSLALVNAQQGFCLIDEIETGLHYTTIQQLWELIFAVANELNIQVFATTHSDDCVRAFQDAAQANEQVEGQLIRLERWDDKHTAIVLNEKDLEASIKYDIETR